MIAQNTTISAEPSNGYHNPNDDKLRFNLARYVEFNKEDDQLVLKARREIAIARNALEEANTVYMELVETLKSLLKTIGICPEGIIQVLSYISQIETKSHNIISMAEKVTKILHTATQIELILTSKMDGMQVYSIISQVPDLLKTTIISITNNDALAAQCATALSAKLDAQLLVLEGSSTPSVQPLIEEQIRAMLASVPTNIDEPVLQPTIPWPVEN